MSDILEQALCHHGIEGQKWGERRYQNYDGSLTDEGRKRYGYKQAKKAIRNLKREASEAGYLAREAQKEYGAVGRAMQEKFASDYKAKESELKQMVQEAKEQFGDAKIKDLKYDYYYDNNGNLQSYVKGSTVNMKDVSNSAIKTMIGTAGLAALGIPLVWISVPTSESHNKKAYKNASKQFYSDYYKQQYS